MTNWWFIIIGNRVNFKKNEKIYDSAKSEVFKMLQEMDKEPKEEELPEDQATSIPFERNHSIVYESTSKTSTKKTSITETSNLSGPIQQQPLWNPRKSTKT